MTITAAQLHDMTKALFEKHTSAKPERFYTQQGTSRSAFFGWHDANDKQRGFGLSDGDSDIAALIITGHLTQWLAERVNEERQDLEIEVYKGKWYIKWEPDSQYSGATLLEAIIAACMEVEQ